LKQPTIGEVTMLSGKEFHILITRLIKNWLLPVKSFVAKEIDHCKC